MGSGDEALCEVCGEVVAGEYITLTAFGVWGEDDDGVAYWPQIDACDLVDVAMEDLDPLYYLHAGCVAMFFDGVLASIPIRRREAGG